MAYNIAHVALAKAVAASIVAASGAGDYSQTVTVERVNVPLDDRDDLPDSTAPPLVTVFAGDRAAGGDGGRDGEQRSYRIVATIRQKHQANLAAATRLTNEDALVGLGEEIEQSIERTVYELAGGITLAWEETSGGAGGASSPLLVGETERSNQFTAVIAWNFTSIF